MKLFRKNPKFVLAILLSVSSLTLSAQDKQTDINTIELETVRVTTIKQGLNLHNEPIAASIITQKEIEKRNITELKDISDIIPNLFIPDYGSRITSAIYIRGMGTRMDQPVMGLNVDNIPVLSKDNYDFEMVDIERIEVLRGPQSTMYGRNTMGGLINIYTISPLAFSGTRLGLEYGTGNTIKANASHYFKVNPNLGMAFTAYYAHTDGLFTNSYDNKESDWEDFGGGRFKIEWRGNNGLSIDNTFAVSALNQGANPYQQVKIGEIRYNDPLTYGRFNISNGLTVKKDYDKFFVSSITSYQYADSDLMMDNDFTENDWMTVNQKVKEQSVTQDFVFRSNTDSKYQWLAGVFGFYKKNITEVPTIFKKDGINDIILGNIPIDIEWEDKPLILDASFETPNYGLALYHQSEYNLGRWNFSAGLRLDYEYSKLNYNNTANGAFNVRIPNVPVSIPGTIKIDNDDNLSESFIEVLPKISVQYNINKNQSFYTSFSRGYKAGGFNIQMFPFIMQEQLGSQMMGVITGAEVDIHKGGRAEDIKDRVKYNPEYSWNYEVGGNFLWRDAGIRTSFALFYIDCKDQQISVIPAGSFGRMTTNAGETRSFGAEVSLNADITKELLFMASYGYTNAKFTKYIDHVRNDEGKYVEVDYSGNYVPFAPQHTLSARLSYSLPIKKNWLDDIIFNVGVRGVGEIYWEEDNSVSQPFYALLDCSIRFENNDISIDIWGRNMMNHDYNTFYFDSLGFDFVQKGKPSTYGVTLNYKF